MQSGQGGQSSSKSDFGLEDLNFDPDTLIGADGTGEQTDFGNVRFNKYKYVHTWTTFFVQQQTKEKSNFGLLENQYG